MWQIIYRCAMAGGILLVAIQSLSAADPNPAQVEKTVRAYISKANQEAALNRESVEESQVVTADLNGDGRVEIILWSTRYGGTYAFSDVTVFTDAGRGYQVAAGTTEALGMVESIEVKNNLIHIHAVWPGPNDPRCCPTVKKTAVYQWQGKALADVTGQFSGKK
ncbi:VCBS repeat-containing protein [Nitrosomonas sp.]|uniref:FG-GAP repeat domain-containing protein n=1 Tax=Nitrosomonas sp. TaxID=42353 RepID=UPI003305E617